MSRLIGAMVAHKIGEEVLGEIVAVGYTPESEVAHSVFELLVLRDDGVLFEYKSFDVKVLP